MGKKEFDEFLKTQPSFSTDLYKEKELREWRYYLDQLYTRITSWLSDYEEKGIVKIVQGEKKIYEEFSGEYDINELVVSLYGKTIVFEPIGTMFFGAKGRVDIHGKNGTVSLCLVNQNLIEPNISLKIYTSEKERLLSETQEKTEQVKPIIWVWKIQLVGEKTRYIELDEDNFFDILLELTNG